MKLGGVLTSSTLDPKYSDFIPIFIRTWKGLFPELSVYIILIAREIPQHLKAYSRHIIPITPIDGVSEVFMSQYIRLLYPCILDHKRDNAILITDMDMLPLNRNYYIKSIKDIEDSNSFVVYRGFLKGMHGQYPMCYCAALPKVWSSVFEIKTLSDIVSKLKRQGGNSTNVQWFSDQIILFKKLNQWNSKTNKLRILRDASTGFLRLSRDEPHNHYKYYINDKKFTPKIHNPTEDLKIRLSNLEFADFHTPRPYKKFSRDINYIVDLILFHLSGEKFSSLCDVSIYPQNYLDMFPNCGEYTNRIIYINEEITDNQLEKIEGSSSFFVKTEYLNFFKDSILPLIDDNKKIVLVTHNSDKGITTTDTCHKYLLDNPKIHKWLAQNVAFECNKDYYPKLIGIPIGLENSQWKGSNFNVLRDIIRSENLEKTGLMYFNFNTKTNSGVRNGIRKTLLKNGFEESESKEWREYLRDMSRHKFVVSPPGNGLDCHRTWEALYLGSIPIVQNNSLKKHFEDLPIVFVDDWNNITPDFLESEYNNKFANSDSCCYRNYEKLTIGYWKNKIQENN